MQETPSAQTKHRGHACLGCVIFLFCFLAPQAQCIELSFVTCNKFLETLKMTRKRSTRTELLPVGRNNGPHRETFILQNSKGKKFLR